MTLVIPEGYVHVVESLTWQDDPEPMAVTYAVAIETATPPTDANACALELGTLFDTNIMPLLNQIITHVGTEIRWQNAAPPADPLVGFAASGVNGDATDAGVVPQNTAFLMHKRSSFPGRSGRGRCYLPAVAEADVNNVGVVRSAVVTAFNAAFEDWRTDIAASASFLFMAILHDSAGAAAADAPRPVASINLDGVVATQRRRLRR